MPTTRPLPAAVLARLEEEEALHLSLLAELCRIPSDGIGDSPAKREAADFLVSALRERGLEAGLAEVEGAPPYVVGEWLGLPGAPTLLLYGHYDVMPAGRTEVWESPPWELTERGGRLRARGAADDKGNLALLLAVISAWFHGAGAPPLNLRVLIEGEEENASEHFQGFLERHAERVKADFALVCDGGNLEPGLPTLTCSTRGVCRVEVECRALEGPVHAGLWGGSIPDPAMTLCALIGRLVDDQGRITVPGFYDKVFERPEAERKALATLDDTRHFGAARLVEGASPWGEAGYATFERLWTRPALIATVLEGRELAKAAGAYMDKAIARVQLRAAPGMDVAASGKAIADHLLAMNHRGTALRAEVSAGSRWWRVDPSEPAVLAASRALEAGYGRPVVLAGDGASIGVLDPISRLNGGTPCLLLGAEDPDCGAHAENEGLLVEEWRHTAKSVAHLFAELASLPAGRGGLPPAD